MSSKRKLEEQRKKDEEERLARLHDDFVESFSDKPKLDKVWVKAGTAESERKGYEAKREIYKPTSKIAENFKDSYKSRQDSERDRERDRPPSKPTKGSKSTKKSNLEKFKEEIKAMQAERDERKKLREHIKECEDLGIAPTMLTSSGKPSRFEMNKDTITSLDSVEADIYGKSAPDFTSDLSTTNIYCGNLNPKMTEAELCEVFGEYGPLASIKIMWPRTDEEKSKGRHSGFVGFMSRKDAEEAYEKLRGQQIQGFEMRLSWGKAIPIPHRPVYLPPSMQKETLPPPPSGLPFNAQPPDDRWKPAFDIYGQPDFSKKLDETDVKIVIPTERSLLCLIHRMVEYVVREGPLFEAMIMNRECKNPRFRFLFDNQTPAHCYYRWKLFSILQGDQPHNWGLKTFQMFVGGSYWIPPPMNPYMQKPNSVGDKKMGNTTRKVDLSERQREKLEDDLRDLTTERHQVGALMVWCLEHADAAEQIVETITESLTTDDTPLNKKLARLYVVNDLLHNSSVRLPNVSYFRKYFETVLPAIFESFNETYKMIEGRLKAENFKQKILNIFRTWEDWVIYPIDQLIRYQNTFLGLSALNQFESDNNGVENENDVDGAPLSPTVAEQDVDGEPLSNEKSDKADDIDGAPIDEDVDGEPLSNRTEENDSKQSNKSTKHAELEERKTESKNKFAKTKWETIDDEVVKSQAITTSKWETLDEPINKKRKSRFEHSPKTDDENIDGTPLDKSGSSSPEMNTSNAAGLSGLSALTAAYTPKNADKKESSRGKIKDKRENNISRQKLRDIEMKVVKYQDELEAGRRSRKSGKTLTQQVHAYREKLLNKELDEWGEYTPRSNRDRSPDRLERSERKRYASRSPSPKRRPSPSPRRERYRSRSNSPYQRRHKSRSPEPSRRRRSRSPRRRSRSRTPEKYSRSSKKSRK